MTELRFHSSELLASQAIKTGSHNKTLSMPGLRPNTQVLYHPLTSVVSFISANAETSIEEFAEEWDRVRRTLAVARHGTIDLLSIGCFVGALTSGFMIVAGLNQKKGFKDVRLSYFDLSTVRLSYHPVNMNHSSPMCESSIDRNLGLFCGD